MKTFSTRDYVVTGFQACLRYTCLLCLLVGVVVPWKVHAGKGGPGGPTWETFSCPAGQVKSINQTTFNILVNGPHCAEHGGPEPQIGNDHYSSPAAWASAVAAYCDGSASGNTVVWYPPPYACINDTIGGEYCLDATATYGGPNRSALAGGPISCTSGYFVAPPPPLPPPPTGNNCCSTSSNQGVHSAGEPIEVSSGNEFAKELDYQSGDGRLNLVRSYNSSAAPQTALSTGWQTNFDAGSVLAATLANTSQNGTHTSGIYADPATACTTGWPQIASTVPGLSTATATYANGICTLSTGLVIPVYATDPSNARSATATPYLAAAVRPNGAIFYFTCSAGSCHANTDIALGLGLPSGGGFTLTDENDTTEQYDSSGNLVSTTQRGGYQQQLSRTNGQLNSVTDSFGRSLTFNYNTDGTLHSVTTPDGAVVYGYDGSSRLGSVTYPDNSSRSYSYGNAQYGYALTGITDERTNSYESWSYEAMGRAYASSLAGGVNAVSLRYNTDGTTTVTDAFGVQRTYLFQSVNNRQKVSSIVCPVCSSTGGQTIERFTYDSAGYFQSHTDQNGNTTNYIYDDTRGLETSRTEAVGTAQQRTIATTWEPNFRLVHEIDEPGRKTVYTHDTSGNLTQKDVSDTASGLTRTWKYSNYTAWGMPQTITGPRTDVAQVTQIAYYPIVSGDVKSGQVHTITDALGHITTFNNYDPSGRPLQITDPNLILTTLAYYPRGWIKSVQVGSHVTSYSYWPTGQLKQLSYPSGASLTAGYMSGGTLMPGYNAAHQLTDVTDQLGNRIHYTPDAMGNNTQVDVYDASGTKVQTHQRIYNTLNELYQDVGAYSGEVTQYGYDNNGNLTSVTDPLTHQSGYAYDALNRLYQYTDPNKNNTKYGLDALDQLTSVTDPRTLQTIYTLDALDNLSKLTSPDSGIATQPVIDAAGNVIQRKDAKGQLSKYQYDALDRVVLITRADNSTISYIWDQYDGPHSYGIGHLTHVTDSSSGTSIDLRYNGNGQVLSRTYSFGTTTLTTTYIYDTATGNRTQMLYPSGDYVTYNWTNGQISSALFDGSAFITSLSWQPFGGPKSWTFVNGDTDSRSYDLDGRISADPVQSVGYDLASRVTSWGNSKFGYADPMDFFAGSGYVSYGYDANGNIASYCDGTHYCSNVYTIDPGSNRVTKNTDALPCSPQPACQPVTSYYYDANGSFTNDGTRTLSYDASGRMTSFSSGSTSATYAYDGLGERVSKTVGTTGTRFIYDEAGHLIGEFTSTGGLIEETAYLGDMPIITRPAVGRYYVHADYRNTPRMIDDGSRNVVWTWDGWSYGRNASVASNGFVYNLRFPGQYYDSESGLFSNGFRDYDPTMGRYVESDPIGLGGGINTYAYVRGNPISLTDRLGLDPGFPPGFGFNGSADVAAQAAMQSQATQAAQAAAANNAVMAYQFNVIVGGGGALAVGFPGSPNSLQFDYNSGLYLNFPTFNSGAFTNSAANAGGACPGSPNDVPYGGLYAGLGGFLGFIKGSPDNIGGDFENVYAQPPGPVGLAAYLNSQSQFQGAGVSLGPAILAGVTNTNTQIYPFTNH